MANPYDNIFPDLGPKKVNDLMEERLSNLIVRDQEVPVKWTSPESGASHESYPVIYIEFIDIEPAQDREFSGIIECDLEPLSDGITAEVAQIGHPQAYFCTYEVHLYSQSLNDMVDLVQEVAKKIPSKGHLFNIDGRFRLAVQRPGAALNADVPEELFFHRIYTYKVESYIFDHDTMRVKSTSLKSNIEGNKIED